MLYNTIYTVNFKGGANIQQGGANAPPRPPLNETLVIVGDHFSRIVLSFVKQKVSGEQEQEQIFVANGIHCSG